MEEMEKNYYRLIIPSVLDALRKKHYDPYFFETKAEAKQFILEQIQPHQIVGIGGSVTLRKHFDIVEEIRKKGNLVWDHWEADEDPPLRLEIQRKHGQVDVFISGINALTKDGVIVDLDGQGNRVASICSGPKKVIAVAGVNKIVDSLDSAITRVRYKAAILNAMRRQSKSPCVETGVCSDCNATERVCCALLILLKKTKGIDHFSVILVNEEMGY